MGLRRHSSVTIISRMFKQYLSQIAVSVKSEGTSCEKVT